jgi:multidrug efflux pump subunit AcrB
MWIVRLALRRTYTFVVAALLIAVLGAVSIYRMSADIFPNIDIPIVSVVWQYLGEGGEQNAPLSRAVIGGLLVATIFTLFFVPVMYSLLRRQPPATDPEGDRP